MSKFNPLKVKEIKRETPLAVSIVFDVPADLKADYQFEAGQYVNIKSIINGEELRRSYSISSSPKSDELRIVVKAVENGVFSNYATQQLQVGDILEVAVPEGKFVLENKDAKVIAGIAAGSGITPIISLAKDVLENATDTIFVLIYGNKSVEDTIYYNEIEALKSHYLGRFFVHYTFTKEHPDDSLFGRIERSTINFVMKNKHNEKQFDEYFLCGPEDMIKKVTDVLKENGTAEEQIHYELFTTSSTNGEIPVSGEGMVKVTVLVDDVETTFNMPRTENILNAALKHGVDAPYSCQGGICSSCMCRTIKGSAEMKTNHILMDDEVEEGLLLACQAYVTSDEIYVDFDDV
ncbi:ring-1,2-phenylacetyl-CoA epoxidase subunit PaaE [Paenimyroides aquimaris]|uniref:Ring-1,2-phenylacetyl-CoA epoxidase subunit PaaE n=1 Tax=Paenimyroides marinum TaxID=1159016 RepID=A0A1H6LEW8_9FLAO|nr:ferredoxin--NADP reductase [Paenimyroides aquimaris]SEH83228.1 ring-1,2-phenylacetyl-CoA epoxidase subunit PaaE [Paenimyroides aquimaris]